MVVQDSPSFDCTVMCASTSSEGRAEVSRKAWTATMQFVFMPVIPADLVVFNPMGIQVTYLETDRTLITETP